MAGPGGKLGALRKIAARLRQGHAAEPLRGQFHQAMPDASRTVAGPLLLELVAEGFARPQIEQLLRWCEQAGGERPRAVQSEFAPGHPLDTFRLENAAIGDRAGRLRAALPGAPDSAAAIQAACRLAGELALVDNHYRRQEFLLFTRLELHGLIRPGRILWAAHDEVRQWIKYLNLQTGRDDFGPEKLAQLSDPVVRPLLEDLETIIFLEEEVLLPLAMEVFDAEDWDTIWRYSDQIGWCLVEPRRGYEPGPLGGVEPPPASQPLPTGALAWDEVVRIHAQLPVDLTLVDAEDRVRYFSEGTRPAFYRSGAILGRDVHCCHPPRSVHYVQQAIEDFRAGRATSAQFWRWMGDRLIHIRFVALRNAAGRYCGTLEVVQDITPLRALEGEQLDLKYDPQLAFREGPTR